MLAWLMMACRDDDGAAPLSEAPPVVSDAAGFAPAPVALSRLTDRQWRNAARALTGVSYDGALPLDYVVYGFSAVGASEVTVAPLDLEQYEAAAWAVAEGWLPDALAVDQVTGCGLAATVGEPERALGADDAALCVERFVVGLLRDAWRRPPTTKEVDGATSLYADLAPEVGPTIALQGVVASALLSPNFLFRVEIGASDPSDPSRRALTDHELAARLALVLTDTPPDATLADAADAGALVAPEVLTLHAERLLATDASHEAMVTFFGEMAELARLDLTTKDNTLFPEWTPELVADMQHEVREVFREVALVRQQDLRDLLTTDVTYLSPALAAVYGVPTPADPSGRASLPADQDRGGVLGRAAYLSANAHNTLNSPTRRGKAARTRWLCQDIPAPPPGVVTALEDIGESGTLRDQLEVHMTDPTCNTCHSLMDPIGFTMEHFDPIGAWRPRDNGLPIDASGDLDGVFVYGAAELGRAIADHPSYPGCFTRNVWRHATGHLELESEDALIDAVGAEALAAGFRFDPLVLAIVGSEGFRTVAHPEGGACAVEGQARPCASACGDGAEVCVDGRWSGCTAPLPDPELCNGVDDDCDDARDENLIRSCDDGAGVQTCTLGAWSSCEGPTLGAEETCDGEDDDGDGAIDEDLAVDVRQVTHAALVAAHESCDPNGDPSGLYCRSAAHRVCGGGGCGAVSGPPIVAVDADGGLAAVTCLTGTEAVPVGTTLSELAIQHGGCTAANVPSPDCNASINRLCAAWGFGTGYGPVELSGDAATIVCTPAATVRDAYYSVLAGYGTGCDGAVGRSGPACDAAIHSWCRDEGYASGHGPLENSGDLLYVACVGGAP